MPQSYIESYTLEKRQKLWSNIIGRNLAEVLVADSDDGLVGFLCFGQPKTLKGTEVYDLSSIYIDPSKISTELANDMVLNDIELVKDVSAQQNV
ncbi:hypothetical protein WD347_004671 [Vibrio parahaemolyticus]|nr:hypothetical protein [Vibrio parahaemolyticus]EJG0923869.1 hypothetical protein [Vibrio parahaemolyticus O1:K68]EJG0933529.1 hypothetical protein [Vibrio parahaemolyticus O1]EJG0947720.1 hypothetical protein [Vibrio parahaemolyticus O10]EGQ9104684.1 hypothetical protein [Vibrio parahaemolyticus]